MEILFVLLSFLGILAGSATGAPQTMPECKDAALRAQVRAAVEQQLVLQGVPPPAEVFKLLDRFSEATSPLAKALTEQARRTINGTVIETCEANNSKLDAPMFVTIFFGGFGVPQPSAYVFNIGIPGAVATIGKPPAE